MNEFRELMMLAWFGAGIYLATKALLNSNLSDCNCGKRTPHFHRKIKRIPEPEIKSQGPYR